MKSRINYLYGICIVLITGLFSCNNTAPVEYTAQESIDSTMLGANLYLQSAAEFAFLCRQTFASAADAVSELRDRPQGEKPFAVVMDLDETVVDNSAYQNHLFNANESYGYETWDRFVKDGAAKDSLITLVPGVLDFINHCKSEGVQVIFISNRMNNVRLETATTLAKLGIDTTGLTVNDSKFMLLKTTTSNKDARRDTVRQYYDPQIFIGDNISDFTSELENLNQQERRELVLSQMSDKIGKQWFLIPNMTYGDWMRGSQLRNAGYQLQD